MKGLGQTSARHMNDAGGDALDLWREPSRRAYAIIDPGAVWLFLRRNLMRMLIVTAMVSAVAFAASLFIFNKYKATAVLMVDPRAAKVTRAGGVIANIGGDAIAIESLVQVANAEGFLGALVDELELTKDDYFAGRGATPEMTRLATIEKLGSKLTIARRGTTYVIDVTAVSTSAEKIGRAHV